MNLHDIIARTVPPRPWDEGDNIPWNEPEFSERMLREHLTQTHDLASRRFETIDRQVAWIHERVLKGKPTRVLELGCGPGFYTNRLAKRGHTCMGIDFGPASIRTARERAAAQHIEGTAYHLDDVRTADFGEDYGLVMMNFGQLNVFRREEAADILRRAHDALEPGGIILLEPQRYETVEGAGKSGTSWYAVGEEGGLFSDRPHLVLTESFWDEESRAAITRFYVVDAETAEVTRHSLTTEAYTEDEYRAALESAGFTEITFFPSLVGVEVDDPAQAANIAITASRKGR